MASSFAGSGSGRGKRRVTVVLHSDPLAELQAASTAVTSAGSSPSSRGPPQRRRSAIPPPITSLELLRVALQSVMLSETAPMLTLSTLHDAATGWLHDAGSLDPSKSGVEDSSSAAARGVAPDDQGFVSLEDEDDEYSDRETNSPTHVPSTASRRQPPSQIAGEKASPLSPPAFPRDSSTSLPFHSRHFAASLTFMKAAVHCLSCEESRFVRMSVALAEQACIAAPTTRSRCLLAWCCVRYAEVCADVTLRRSLEDLAAEALAAAEMNCGGATSSDGDGAGSTPDDGERLHLREVQAWCYALLGAHAEALQHAEEAMRMSLRNASIVCLAALLRTSQGDLAGAEMLLLWLVKEQPHHMVAKGLLALVWSQKAVARSSVEASEHDGDHPQDKLDIDGLLVALTTEARQLAAYARGTRDFGVAAPSSVVPTASPTSSGNGMWSGAAGGGGGSVGHMDANWSCIPRISNKVAHTFLFASCIAGRLRRQDLADALHTATLEWLAEAAAADGSSVAVTLSAPFAADVLKQQAVLAADAGACTKQSKELLEQSYALFPSGEAAMIAGCLHLWNADSRGGNSGMNFSEVSSLSDAQEEAQAWFERALHSNPVDACTLQGVAWGKSAQNDWSTAVDLLVSAATCELQQPILPYKALLPWADLF